MVMLELLVAVQSGSAEKLKSLTSLLKHLLTMGVRATGRQSFSDEMVEDLATGMMAAILKEAGTTDSERGRLKVCVNTPAS